MQDERIAVIGGCGHVGLPLALVLAAKGYEVDIYDIHEAAVRSVCDGEVRFVERGAAELLQRHIGRNLRAGTDPSVISKAAVVICVIGTPIDEHLNPQLHKLLDAVAQLKHHLRPGQLFVLRSTVYPGATQALARWLDDALPGLDVAFCPERVAQGVAIEEIQGLPQIVSGITPRAVERATTLFSCVAPKVVVMSTLEAELGKLFCNAWRYITFAVANQFYELCAENHIDYARIRKGVMDDYPRMRSLPGAGFAAGPCLFKDTMQLSAYFNNDFSLGQTAMMVNEGMPRALMKLLRPLGLADKTIGLLGMAFKGDNDDTRESLAFKMKKLAQLECKRVLCADEYVRAPWIEPLELVMREADVLVITAPHARYASLAPTQPTLDPWDILGRGGLIQ